MSIPEVNFDETSEFWKHIPRGHLDNGKIGLDAFIPRTQDGGKLSVDSVTLCPAAKESNETFSKSGGNPIFTGKVTTPDFENAREKLQHRAEEQKIQLAKEIGEYFQFEYNPIEAKGGIPKNDAHCLVLYHDLIDKKPKEKKKLKQRVAQFIADKANAHGIFYPEDVDTSLVSLPVHTSVTSDESTIDS